MAKLLGKTLAVMLTVLGGELLWETGVLAEDAAISEQATAHSEPVVVEPVASQTIATEENKEQDAKQRQGDKGEFTLTNPSLLSLLTVDEYTHPTLETTLKPEFSSQSTQKEHLPLVSQLRVGEQNLGDKQEKDKEELTAQNSEPLILPTLDEYTQPDLGDSLDFEMSEEEAAEDAEMEQVTNVTELSDVQPTDWAFEALRSMVERYGCLEGYPDRTYRGNRAMSRYEFAAGLNRCLDRISELLEANDSFVTKEDLAKLLRLQEEYATELAQLKNRVDTLEARTTTLEGQQFSTTAKMGGLVSVHVADAFGDRASSANSTILAYEANIFLFSSFTGKDVLNVTLGAGNTMPTPPGSPGIGRQLNTGVNFPSDILTSQGPVLPGQTDETRLLIGNSEGFADNDFFLSQLQYQFPLNESMRVTIDAYASNRILSAPITPYNDPFTGALSFYGKINPILYPIFLGSGVGLSWKTTPWLNMDFYYGSQFGQGNTPFQGFFNGGYVASGRAALNFGALRLAFNYIHGYSPNLGVDTYSGSNAAKVRAIADPTTFTFSPVVSNTYVLGGFYRLTPTVEIGASAGFINARTLAEGVRGDAQVWDYRLNLALYDLGKKGNFAGIIFGIQPKLTGTSNAALAQAIGYPAGQRSDRDTGFHIEAFYSYRLNDHISITPGVFWLTAPNHDARNPDVVVGVIRTTFGF